VTFASFSNVCFHGVQVIAFFPSSYKAWAARSEKRTMFISEVDHSQNHYDSIEKCENSILSSKYFGDEA